MKTWLFGTLLALLTTRESKTGEYLACSFVGLSLTIDFRPVMPVEKMLVTLKPINFFTRNPALDVPISDQAINKSVLVVDEADKKCCEQPRL